MATVIIIILIGMVNVITVVGSEEKQLQTEFLAVIFNCTKTSKATDTAMFTSQD